MAGPLGIAVIVCGLLVSLITAAGADAWVRWWDQSTNQYLEVVEVINPIPSLESYVWQFGGNFNNPGLLLDDQGTSYHDADYPQFLWVNGGGSGPWALGDPAIPVYVRLVVNIKNVGTEDWIDFHLRAVNGCFIYPKYVMDSGQWSRYWDYSGNSMGWDYIMDPAWSPWWGDEYGPVRPGEYFTCETWVAVTSPDGFQVKLWPTAVPEPSSLVILACGGVGLLGRLLRKRLS
ncbi:MAG: hypothetical protein ACPL7O_00605 [Armatimonadota bacterium]